MIRVVVAGAAGRMGRLALEALRAAEDVEVCGTLVRGSDAAAVLDETRPDVLLDFTLAPASRELGPLAAERGISPVIGTSGLTDSDVSALHDACARAAIGGLLVPNFSLGAVLQMRLAADVARYLPCTGIHEVHHPGKRDSPSGTARSTAARIAAARAQVADPVSSGFAAGPGDVGGSGGSGGAAGTPIRSERLPGVIAEQEVHFAHAGESLVLSHVVTDRSAYMPGVLLAVRRVRALKGLVVGLDTLLL